MLKCHLKKTPSLGVQFTESFYLASFEFPIELDSFIPVSASLYFLDPCNTFLNLIRRLSDPVADQPFKRYRCHIRTEIQSVKQWLADPSKIL